MMRFTPRSPPFPSIILHGRLRLAGVDEITAYRMTQEMIASFDSERKSPSLNDMLVLALDSLGHDETVSRRLETVIRYERSRLEDPETPPIILCIEGASATGKSILSLMLAGDIVASRILSTDTIRQVVRAKSNSATTPELYCHTYQAYRFKQAGPEDQPAVVRGFIAQYELLRPIIVESVRRISDEGVSGIVEGVHLVPGDLHTIPGVLEVLIDPDYETHQTMFMNKGATDGLRTITGDEHNRAEEFEAARDIQDYLRERAESSGTFVVGLSRFESAAETIRELIVGHMAEIVG